MATRSGSVLGAALLCLGAAGACGPALGEGTDPLSAIDWLSQSVTTPSGTALTKASDPPRDPGADPEAEPLPVAASALPQTVTTSAIGARRLDGVGLISPAATGLPADLWGMGRGADVARLMTEADFTDFPALQGLLLTLLLLESDPPADSGTEAQPDGQLFLQRIDKLLALGALDQAQALIEAGGKSTDPDHFRRAFDLGLLTNREDRVCAEMAASPGLSPTLSARIFCLARLGDFDTAVTTYVSAVALGQLTGDQAELLARYLDPGLADGADPLPLPSPVTPLDLQLHEAIGEPLTTTNLPLAFAHTDLDEITGWKPRIEAAERLVRAGAISPNLLLGYYTEQKAAASGGVWDRVRAFQAFDEALMAGDVAALSKTLDPAFAAMKSVELETAFADLFSQDLAGLTLTGEAEAQSLVLRLLSANYAKHTLRASSADPVLSFALALAHGKAHDAAAPDSLSRAIAAAWAPGAALPPEFQPLIDQGRVGEAALTGALRVQRGALGQPMDVTAGLLLLRKLGLEDTARRAGLELLLLDRRG